MISVLYVDDESALLEISKLYLEKMGDFMVDTAESALVALEKIRATPYDAIVSDYQMPGMDGIQFLKALRSCGDCTPFIIFTGKGREDVVIEAFNEGADFYIQKGGEPRAQFTELSHKVKQAVELRTAEKTLRDSEEKFRTLFNDAILGVFRTTPAGTYEDMNPAFARIYGYNSPEEMMEEVHDIQQQLYVNEEDWATVKYLLTTEGEIRNFVVENRHREGYSLWISVNVRAIKNDAGEIQYYEGTIEDITERERAETALQESEENYRILFENATEGILIAQGDRLILGNPQLINILGFPPEDLITRPFADFIHPDDRETVLDRHQRRMKGEKIPTGYAFRIITRDGGERWVEINSTRITWSGKPASLSFIIDVTERNQMEEALRKSEERYLSLFERSLDCIYIHDLEGNLIDANPTALTLLGYTRDDIPHLSFTSLMNGQQLKKARETIRTIIERGSHADLVEYRLQRKNGEFVDVETKGSLILHDKKPCAILGIARDITYRKRADQALRESEDNYRTVFENTGTATVLVEENTMISLANAEFVHLSGFSKEDIEGKKCWTEFVVREDLERMINQHRLRRQDLEKALTHYDFRFVTKSGDIRNIYLTIDLIPGTKKSVASLLDITDRKRAEEALRQSEGKLHAMLQSIADPMSMMDKDLNIIWANETARQYFGNDLVGRKCYEVFHQRQNPCEPYPCITLESFQDGEIHRHETSVIDTHGQTQFFECSTNVALNDESGKSVAVLEISRDITDRKRAEEALRESEERYRIILDTSQEGIWTLDSNFHINYINEKMAGMLGYTQHEMLGRSFTEFIPKEELPHANMQVELRRKGVRETYERRFLHRNGDIVIMLTSSSTLYNPAGTFSGSLAMFTDITERKRAEEALRESENKFATIFRSSPVVMTLVSATDGTFVDVNDAFVGITGYSRDDVIGKTSEVLGIFTDRTERERMVSSLRDQRCGSSMELRCRMKTGEIRTCLFSSRLILMGEKPLILSTIEDITERKKAEQALRDAALRWQRTFDLTKDAICIIDAEQRIVTCNRLMQETLGLRNTRDLVGRHCWEVVHKTTEPIPFCPFVRMRHSLTREQMELKIGDRWFIVTTDPILDDTRTLSGAVHNIRDITDRKQAEEALKIANKKLNLLSSITRHDINNQLMAIRGYLDLLHDEVPDPGLDTYFTLITNASARISDMIQFTRTYENIGVHAPVWQDCRLLVDTAVKDAPLGEAGVNNDLPPGGEVFADPLIVTVFYNLVDNALRHGEKTMNIRFSLEERDGGHVIICEDDGVGIPVAEKEQIFVQGCGKNTGLGLFLAREILAITGITIKETGNPGTGARFEMTVPKGVYRMRSSKGM